MRGLRSTLILLVILAGLVGYIYFVDSKKPAGDAEIKPKAFANVSADTIEELQIKSADGETSRVQKSGDTWKLVQPVQAAADSTEAGAVATSVASLEINRVVDENPGSLKEYGLDPPRVEVAFRAKGEKDMHRLLVGERTPTGSDLYARLPNEKRVFLINSSNDSTFNKNTFALREKKILSVDREKTDGLELSDGATTFQFAREGTSWKIVKPIAARADFGQIEGIVERLGSAQMQSIVSDNDPDLKKYGLDKPTATMTVIAGGNRTTLTLGKTENAVVFAKDSTRPMIFTVAPTIKSDVIKELAEYRRKDLFDARSFTASKVEIRRGSDVKTFTKSTKDGKDSWQGADGKAVDATKMEDALGRLTGLRATSFEANANPALKSPAAVVTITYDKNTEMVTFAKQGADVVASRADEPGTAKLESMAYDEAMKAVDAVK
jgi:hypothetical protein